VAQSWLSIARITGTISAQVLNCRLVGPGYERSRSKLIAEATGIYIAAIHNPVEKTMPRRYLQTFSIAQTMSSASTRVTTKIEDTAYCLLGIFGINMPLLYGEGANTFIRLQEEIMKHSDDQSLFAWRSLDSFNGSRGLLASSLAEFCDFSYISVARLLGPWSYRPQVPYQATNRCCNWASASELSGQ
jgi:hypothetical protein